MRLIDELKYRKKIFKERFSQRLKEQNREDKFNKIRNSYDGSLFLLEGTKEQIDNLVFDINPITGEKRFAIPEDIIFRIDYTNVDFDNAYIRGMDFTGMQNVYINPQTVFKNDLRDCILNGVYIIGPCDDAYITRTNFTNSIGALVDPSTVYDNDVRGTILTDAVVVDNFSNAKMGDTVLDGASIITQEEKEILDGFCKIKE